ncbi:MAG TPA: PaaI family thioesterase [Bryobacteraceae bacterium]|nr:PaaI family thioesterase [Bryobacteraceae bacterium]
MPDDNSAERTHTFTWDDPLLLMRHGRKLSGAELFDKIRRGEIPQPPFAQLIGLEVFDSGEGRFAMTLQPREFHYNPMGCVHGGILSTLLDTVMSAAVHTGLSAGRGYLTLGININFLQPVYEHTGEVMAEGKLVSMRRQVATAEGRIFNLRGDICATGTATCLIFDMTARKTASKDSSA